MTDRELMQRTHDALADLDAWIRQVNPMGLPPKARWALTDLYVRLAELKGQDAPQEQAPRIECSRCGRIVEIKA